MTKFTMKLIGKIQEGLHEQSFTEKDVDHIEISFGDKKIEIGKPSLERKLEKIEKYIKTHESNDTNYIFGVKELKEILKD